MGRIRTLRHLRAASPGGLNLDFTSGALDSRITSSGGANGTVVNSAGVLVAANAPRFDYNPSTLSALGLLVEEQRTNAIRNNTMVGASPGGNPTNWATWNTTGGGVTLATSAPVVENGITCIDVTVTGTASVTGTAVTASFEQFTQIAALSGQTWTQSVYMRLVSGSMGGARVNLRLSERDSGGASLATSDGTGMLPTGAAIGTQRATLTATLGNASTTFVVPQFRLTTVNTEVYSFTLRIGLPSLEFGPYAGSVIQTSTAALTRTADLLSMTGTNFSSWFTSTSGTVLVEADLSATTETTVTSPLFSIDDGTVNNRISVYKPSGANTIVGTVNVAGVGPVWGTATVSKNTRFKVALAFAPGDQALSVNGAAVETASAATLPTVTQLHIGQRADGGSFLNGHIRRLVFYPRRLSNAELQGLTA